MTDYIVTRHPGAIEWMRRHARLSSAVVLRHVDGHTFEPGDRVCGVLPLALAARICASGSEAHVLTYDAPESARGQELTAEDLEALGTKLVRYEVRVIGETPSGTCGSQIGMAAPAAASEGWERATASGASVSTRK